MASNGTLAQSYRGRFAPSPTGPLHFGSLVAAVGSYLDARAHNGTWLLRIDDIDAPRSVVGATEAILRTLERFGFAWDGAVVRQSLRIPRYRAAFERLRLADAVFACACSRREIADSALTQTGGLRYPGTCRAGITPGRDARAWRFKVEVGDVCFEDALQGLYRQDVAAAVGDFVVWRADDAFAYQLAAVVDDAEAGITQVVRGADLLDSTPRQILLQRSLGYATPSYLHLPAAVNGAGEKLSKQTRARPLDESRPAPALFDALAFLGQEPPVALCDATLDEMWRWAIANWQRTRLPRWRSAAAPAAHY